MKHIHILTVAGLGCVEWYWQTGGELIISLEVYCQDKIMQGQIELCSVGGISFPQVPK